MATGTPYNDLDSELVEARRLATLKTTALNTATGAEKESLFRQLVGKAGTDPVVEPNFRVEFGRNIRVGDAFYANYDCVMLDGAPISIGNHVLFGVVYE